MGFGEIGWHYLQWMHKSEIKDFNLIQNYHYNPECKIFSSAYTLAAFSRACICVHEHSPSLIPPILCRIEYKRMGEMLLFHQDEHNKNIFTTHMSSNLQYHGSDAELIQFFQ